MTDDPTKRHDGGLHQGPDHSSPYPLSRMTRTFDLVDVAREIQRADAMTSAVVGNKLKLIADQIRALQDQARGILERAERDAKLHRARCNFSKTPGSVYHLYRRPDGELYFSMLSPADWKGNPPHAFEGSYKLEVDQSYTPLDEVVDEREQEQLARAFLPR